jgi:hypothetical protein
MPALQGVDHPRAKLSEHDVRTIRATYRPGVVTFKRLASEYGVTPQLVSLIVNGQIWRHLTGADAPEQECN